MTAEELRGLREAYPRRSGGQVWPAAERFITKHLAMGESFDDMLKGAQNYAKHCRQTGNEGTSFVLQARTFYGRDMHWLEWAAMDMRTPAEIASDRAREALVMRAARIGFRQQMEGEPLFRYEDELATAERRAAPIGEPKRFSVVGGGR